MYCIKNSCAPLKKSGTVPNNQNTESTEISILILIDKENVIIIYMYVCVYMHTQHITHAHTMEYYSAVKIMKSYPLYQNGYNWKTSCNKPDSERHMVHVLYMCYLKC